MVPEGNQMDQTSTTILHRTGTVYGLHYYLNKPAVVLMKTVTLTKTVTTLLWRAKDGQCVGE